MRWFFAGLLVVSAVLDIVGALLVQHQTRSQVLEALLPASVTLGGRTGTVLSGLALLLLAGGIARGKRIAFRLTLLVLGATIAFELVKDLDFEAASLFAWILFGLWWFRHHFEADSDPSRMRWGIIVLAIGLVSATVYAIAGAALLENQLQPEFGVVRTVESLMAALAGSPTAYRALTERANWFLSTLPVVSYALIIFALTQLLRPMLAPHPAAADRERVHQLLNVWGRNYISHLAVHGASSYHWLDGDGCVAFTLRGRTALALGDPIGPPGAVERAARTFVAYCDHQDWIPAFYQVDDVAPYRALGLSLVPIGAEALLRPASFRLRGKERADLRYALNRCEKAGVHFVFGLGPEIVTEHAEQLQGVSGRWLQSHHSPELGYSLGTLATLDDPDIGSGWRLLPTVASRHSLAGCRSRCAGAGRSIHAPPPRQRIWRDRSFDREVDRGSARPRDHRAEPGHDAAGHLVTDAPRSRGGLARDVLGARPVRAQPDAAEVQGEIRAALGRPLHGRAEHIHPARGHGGAGSRAPAADFGDDGLDSLAGFP